MAVFAMNHDTGPAVAIEPTDCDPVEIRNACNTPAEWADAIARELAAAGWSLRMLKRLHVPPGDVWFDRLAADRVARRANRIPAALLHLAGDNPAAWRSIAWRTLICRGWSQRMIADAWSVRRSTVQHGLRTLATRVES